MNINFDMSSFPEQYHSKSQIARVLTEKWVSQNMYCPRCGNMHITHFENNRPVADFFCPNCKNEYELKSKNGKFGNKVNDGAYETMIARITSNNNPDFMFMSYDEEKVNDLLFVPKHFFTPDIIEKRKPLSETSQRAGWIGCNILIDKIPKQGIIPIITNGLVTEYSSVTSLTKTAFSLQLNNINARGWLFDVLNCVNQLPKNEFTLSDIYSFEEFLHQKHPQNNNVRPKIRQQLQFLRDNGVIIFVGNGIYRKVLP